ncbi:MAG: ASCH domain-containing protein [Pseudomonadota bacterium]
MKALTIWQPWASLIIAGAKPFEFRGWRAPRSMIGQRIVIHAGSHRVDRLEVGQMLVILREREKFAQFAAETCLHADLAIPVLERARAGQLPMSAGIGSAVIGEPRNGFDIAAEFGVERANDSDRDDQANWGWPMLDVEAWAEPVPMRGAQGFWTWPTPEQALL